MLRGLLGRAQLPQREPELVVDLADLGVAAPALPRQLQRAPRRRGRVRGTVERELGAAEVEQVERALLRAHRGFENGQRLRGALRVEQREAELIARGRIVGREPQLRPELLDRLVETGRAGARVGEQDHAEVVVGAAHPRVLVERGPQHGARAIVFAGVAPGRAR